MIKKFLDKVKNPGQDLSFLVKKSSLALVLRAGGMFTQYLFVLITARLLGAKALGSFTIAYTVIQLASIFSLMGLDNLLVRVIAAKKAQGDFNAVKTAYRQFFRITAISSLIWTAALFLGAEPMAVYMFHKPNLAEPLQIIALSLPPFVMMVIDSAAFRGYKNMTGFAIFRALIPLIGAMLVALSFYMNLNFSPVFCFTVSTFLIGLISYRSWHSYSKLEMAVYTPERNWKAILHDSFPMMLTGSIFFVLSWTDNIILGIFRPEAEVGIYDTAFKVAGASAIALLAINAIQAPSFAEMHSKGETKRLKKYVLHSTRLIFIITLPVTLATLFFPAQILSIFGPEFRAASLALCIMSIGNFVNAITGSVGILLQMSGHQKPYNTIITSTAIGSIILNFLLIPKYGITGAAIVSASAKIFQNIASVIYTYRKMNIVSIYLPGIDYLIKPVPEKITNDTPVR